MIVLILSLAAWTRTMSCGRQRALTPFRHGTHRALAFLVFVALLVVFNPEMRLLLLVIDAVGIDVFLMLILFQLQGGIIAARRYGLPMLWRILRDWGPLPFGVPTPALFRKHPILSACSIPSPLVALTFLGALAFLGFAGAATVIGFYA